MGAASQRTGVEMLKKLLLILALSCGAALPAFADAVSDLVIGNLKAQGFTIVQMDRTWLGRMWILARNSEVQREVVFNPVTGEILRDYTVLLASLGAPRDGSDADHTLASSDPISKPAGVTAPPSAAAGAPPAEPEYNASDMIVSAPINPVQ